MKNILLAISGPSGVGKGTIVDMLLAADDSLAESVSCTTRAPREREVNGREYFYITRAEFEQKIRENAFLEYDEHFGNLYGTPEAFVKKKLKEKSVILEIDVVGAMNAKARIPETVTVFIAPPSKEELVSRLQGRKSENEEQIENRLQRLEYELSFAEKYDYVVVNDELQSAYEEIREIIRREKEK